MIENLRKKLVEHDIDLELSEAAKSWVASDGFDREYGARPLRRSIRKNIENPLSTALIKGDFDNGDCIYVDLVEEKLILEKKAKYESIAI
jgi:ATP-dependent Clp protease ATP-binding subunit ClpC